jgi:hypothetical protein
MAEEITNLQQAISQYETQVIIKCTHAIFLFLGIDVYVLALEVIYGTVEVIYGTVENAVSNCVLICVSS